MESNSLTKNFSQKEKWLIYVFMKFYSTRFLLRIGHKKDELRGLNKEFK